MTLYEEVRAALRESQFRPRKRLGQNFLIHERVIDSIMRLVWLSWRIGFMPSRWIICW